MCYYEYHFLYINGIESVEDKSIHFLYINGIERVEDKSIQGNGLLKLTFYTGTDMSEALEQNISYGNRARACMAAGTVSTFVSRLDGSFFFFKQKTAYEM